MKIYSEYNKQSLLDFKEYFEYIINTKKQCKLEEGFSEYEINKYFEKEDKIEEDAMLYGYEH